MVITGAFFCEAAATYEQKLNVLGGVWDWMYVGDLGDGIDVSPTLVVLVQRETGEQNPSDVKLTIRNPDGETIRVIEIKYEAPADTNLGFFHFSAPFRVQAYGRYVVELSTNVSTPVVVALNIAGHPNSHRS